MRTVIATSRDIAAWEAAKAGRSIAQLVGDGVTMSELYALAWTAAKRREQFEGSLAEFKASVDLAPELADRPAEDDEGPTPPEA